MPRYRPANASIADEKEKAPPGNSAADLSGYRIAMSRDEAARTCLLPYNWDGRAKIRMSRDLRIYSNLEYVYAIFPIALALFWCKGGREIANSEPLYMIFTILTHCLNRTDGGNYFVRTDGRRFCLGALIEESSPLSPLDSRTGGGKGPNSRLANDIAPTTFYLPLYGLVIA